jgi:hypothetical protein
MTREEGGVASVLDVCAKRNHLLTGRHREKTYLFHLFTTFIPVNIDSLMCILVDCLIFPALFAMLAVSRTFRFEATG